MDSRSWDNAPHVLSALLSVMETEPAIAITLRRHARRIAESNAGRPGVERWEILAQELDGVVKRSEPLPHWPAAGAPMDPPV